MAQARADDVALLAARPHGQRDARADLAAQSGCSAATRSASFCRATSRACRVAALRVVVEHDGPLARRLPGDPPRDQQHPSPARQRRPLAGDHGLVDPPAHDGRQVAGVAEHVPHLAAAAPARPARPPPARTTSKRPPPSVVAEPLRASRPRARAATAASVTDVTCGGTTRSPREVATSQPPSRTSAPQASTRSSASGDARTATRTGSGGRANRRCTRSTRLTGSARPSPAPAATGPAPRARPAGRTPSCTRSGASTGFIRCSLPFSAATRRTVAISCSRASTALT